MNTEGQRQQVIPLTVRQGFDCLGLHINMWVSHNSSVGLQ